MIKDILKQAGVKTMEEFYEKFPTEEAFINTYPDFAKKMKMGGTPNAFPQTATMDNFFSYGVPTPPTYHQKGGATGLPNMYPQIQSEAQFFSPVYSDSPNPYNKAKGGVSEAFPQAVLYDNPARGNAFGFMQGGGQTETIGVQNRIGNFMNKIADTATSVKNKELLNKFKSFAKHNGYQVGGPTKIEGITDENSITMPSWDTGNTVPSSEGLFADPIEMGIMPDLSPILTDEVGPSGNKKIKKGIDPTGLHKFYRNQAFKSLATSAINSGQDFDEIGMTTRSFEMMNPALGVDKGTMNPQDGNIFYDKNYSVSDNFAPQYRQLGGGINEGDVVSWDEETIKQFLEAGGEIEYLD